MLASVENRAALASEARVDDLQADVFRELGYIGDDRLQAGYVHHEDRTRLARFIVQGCRLHDIVECLDVSRKNNRQTGEEFVLVEGTNPAGEHRAFLVRLPHLLALRTHVTQAQLRDEAQLYGQRHG